MTVLQNTLKFNIEEVVLVATLKIPVATLKIPVATCVRLTTGLDNAVLKHLN